MEEKQRDGRGAEFDCVATSVCAASSSRGSLSESRGDRGHIEECIAIERVILMLTIIEGW